MAIAHSPRTRFVGSHVHPLTKEAVKFAAFDRGISSSSWIAEAVEEKLRREKNPVHAEPHIIEHLDTLREGTQQ